mmetsp:Transcript_398/g.568  ORF Transcript_398/g.568 Transcript_398/m.568 type:complete len:408 (+) Transcript_398:207-1430(+)
MNDAFDPFNVSDDFVTVKSLRSDTSMSSSKSSKRSLQNTSMNDASFFDVSPQFDASFGSSFDGKSSTKVNQSTNSSLDSDIFSELFKDSNSNHSNHSPKISAELNLSNYSDDTNNNRPLELPIVVETVAHETMTCVYDNSSQYPNNVEITGSINIIPTKAIQGQTFYVSIKDPNNHIGQITTYIDYAREMKENRESLHHNKLDTFVKIQKKDGCRVFQVDIPVNLNDLNSNPQYDPKPINILKYSGSEFLRPIPLLVNCKVRVAGNFCRVGVKVRANPTNKKNIRNVGILMAVPPDVSGETMKMSLRGGVWDPMRRIIIWSSPMMKSGQTIEFQLQFEYLAASVSKQSHLPLFPVLVRCDGIDDQLSDVCVKIGGEMYNDVHGVQKPAPRPYRMKLSKSYRLFHRKI